MVSIDKSLAEDLKYLRDNLPTKATPAQLYSGFLSEYRSEVNKVIQQRIQEGADPDAVSAPQAAGFGMEIEKPSYKAVKIQHVPDPDFKDLNGETGYLFTGSVTRRKRDFRGNYRKDSEGDYIQEVVKIEPKCSAVLVRKSALSDVTITKPRVKGLQYIETVRLIVDEYRGDEEYRLIQIPRRYLYAMNFKTLYLGTSRTPSAVFQVKLVSPWVSSTASSYGNSTSNFFLSIVDKMVTSENTSTRHVIAVSADTDNLQEIANVFLQWLDHYGIWHNVEYNDQEGSLTMEVIQDFDDVEMKPEVEEMPLMLPEEYSEDELKVDLSGGAEKKRSLSETYGLDDDSDDEGIGEAYNKIAYDSDLDAQYRKEHPEEFADEGVGSADLPDWMDEDEGVSDSQRAFDLAQEYDLGDDEEPTDPSPSPSRSSDSSTSRPASKSSPVDVPDVDLDSIFGPPSPSAQSSKGAKDIDFESLFD